MNNANGAEATKYEQVDQKTLKRVAIYLTMLRKTREKHEANEENLRMQIYRHKFMSAWMFLTLVTICLGLIIWNYTNNGAERTGFSVSQPTSTDECALTVLETRTKSQANGNAHYTALLMPEQTGNLIADEKLWLLKRYRSYDLTILVASQDEVTSIPGVELQTPLVLNKDQTSEIILYLNEAEDKRTRAASLGLVSLKDVALKPMDFREYGCLDSKMIASLPENVRSEMGNAKQIWKFDITLSTSAPSYITVRKTDFPIEISACLGFALCLVIGYGCAYFWTRDSYADDEAEARTKKDLDQAIFDFATEQEMTGFVQKYAQTEEETGQDKGLR